MSVGQTCKSPESQSSTAGVELPTPVPFPVKQIRVLPDSGSQALMVGFVLINKQLAQIIPDIEDVTAQINN